MFRFDTNFDKTTISIVEIYWKSFKNFPILTPHKEQNENFPHFPRFLTKILIFVQTWNLWASKIYICGTFWQNYIAVGSWVPYLWPVWDLIFAKNHNFLVKTPKNWICSKIKTLASFLLKVSHNTYITNTTTKKI